MVDGPVEGAVHIPPGPPSPPMWSDDSRTVHVQTQRVLEEALTKMEDDYKGDWLITYKAAGNASAILSMELAATLFDLGYRLVREPGR